MLVRVVFTVSIVLLPAILMGGTLPLLARHLIQQATDTRHQVGKLYALNSMGAVLGAGLCGFFTLPLLGIHPSLVIASLINLLAAILVYPQLKTENLLNEPTNSGLPPHSAKLSSIEEHTDTAQKFRYTVALVALGLSGFAAMGYEVLFLRIISVSFGASTYSFSVMLMCFVSGIALGSALVARLKIKRIAWALAVSQFMIVAAFVLVTPLIERLPYFIGLLRINLLGIEHGFELYQLGKAALCFSVLLIPTMCLGFCFPLVAQIGTSGLANLGSRIGLTYAWNTTGNLLGIVVTSLILFPLYGLPGAFHWNLAMNLLAGFALLVVAGNVAKSFRLAAGVCICLILSVYWLTGLSWPDSISLARDHLRLRTGPEPSLEAAQLAQHPASSFSAWKRIYTVDPERTDYFYHDQDAHNTVLVSGSDDNILLSVNGKPDASTHIDLDTQLLLAHLPLFLAPDARSLLVIGHGSGITAGSAMRHPLKSADIVEISQAVINADHMFAEHNYHVLDDRRVQHYVEDGLSFLNTTPEKYDVIISEPSNPWISGVSALFTIEYFESVRNKLNNRGLFTLWFHTYEQSDNSVQLVLRTLASVFPHAMIFADNDLGNLFVVASQSPLQADFAKMTQRFNIPAVKQDLSRIGMSSLASLFSHHRISQENFTALQSNGPVNTLTHQQLEYAAPRSFFEDHNSFFLEEYDGLIQVSDSATGLLLDGYIAYRQSINTPMTRQEFLQAADYALSAGGYGERVAMAIGLRAVRAGARH